MSKKIILIFVILCEFFIIQGVSAETCTWFEDFSGVTGITLKDIRQVSPSDKIKLGEKVYISFTATGKIDSNVDFRLYFQSTGTDRVISVILWDVKPDPNGDGTTYTAYYTLPSQAYSGVEYKYSSLAILVKNSGSNGKYTTPSGKITSFDLICGRYVFDEKDLELHKAIYNASLLQNGFKEVRKIKTLQRTDVLKGISLNNNNVYSGEKITYNISLQEAVDRISIRYRLKNTLNISNEFFVTLDLDNDINETNFEVTGYAPIIGGFVLPGDYEAFQIQLWNKDKFYIYTNNLAEIVKDAQGMGVMPYVYFPYSLDIKLNDIVYDEAVNRSFKLNDLLLKNKNISIGSSVPVKFKYLDSNSENRIKSVYLNFHEENIDAVFSSYLKSLDEDSYFIVPSLAKKGTYQLDSIVVTSYTKSGELETFAFNANQVEQHRDIFAQKLIVAENDNEDMLYFSSEDFNDGAYEAIKNSKENSIIVIDANYQSIVPYEVFELIKDSSRQVIIHYKDSEWVVNGIDVDDSRVIDVSVNYYNLNESNLSNELKSILNVRSVVMEFSENGQLPGRVLFRFKNDDIFSKLNSNKYYVYHVDEENNQLNKVALELQKSYDGYVEFYINHNSKYVISAEEVSNNNVLGEDDLILQKNISLKEKNTIKTSDHSLNLLLYTVIGIVVVLIILLILFIINICKKKSIVVRFSKEDDMKEKME